MFTSVLPQVLMSVITQRHNAKRFGFSFMNHINIVELKQDISFEFVSLGVYSNLMECQTLSNFEIESCWLQIPKKH